MEFDNDIFANYEKDIVESYKKAVKTAKLPIEGHRHRELFCKLVDGTYRRGTHYDFELDLENKTVRYFREIIPFTSVASFSCYSESYMSYSEHDSLYEEQLLKSFRK